MKHRKRVVQAVLSLLFAISTVSVVGCSGGGSSGSSTTPITVTDTTALSGLVADGYLVGAKVCLDKNYNDSCDTDEPSVFTDSTGRYTFTLQAMEATGFPLIVEADENTIDLDTNLAIGEKWHFKATVGNESFISPLTTLISREMDLNGSLTLEQAMSNLQTDLGLSIDTATDYIVAKNTQAHNGAKIIAKSLAHSETLLNAAYTLEPQMIRLLAAQQIRQQTAAIKNAIDVNDTAFLCDVNTTDVAGQVASLHLVVASSLSVQLQNDLLYMWEEEKLARDVYLTLYEKWGAKIFINIANNAEQTHINSVKSMIDKYQVATTNYANYTARGVFLNNDLQNLYNTLVAQGSVSVVEAYKVGQLIEITDIADLDMRLVPTDLPADIRAVYENLRRGSQSHLAAFNKQL